MTPNSHGRGRVGKDSGTLGTFEWLLASAKGSLRTLTGIHIKLSSAAQVIFWLPLCKLHQNNMGS